MSCVTVKKRICDFCGVEVPEKRFTVERARHQGEGIVLRDGSMKKGIVLGDLDFCDQTHFFKYIDREGKIMGWHQ